MHFEWQSRAQHRVINCSGIIFLNDMKGSLDEDFKLVGEQLEKKLKK